MSHESDSKMRANAERIVRFWRAMRAIPREEVLQPGFHDDVDRQYDVLKNSMPADTWEQTVELADKLFRRPDQKYLKSLN